MSFAYIDSQGKEVGIPGPDALRLRIELGAITDSTRFYDVAEDRWAAASDHEIYRQLKRDIESVQYGDFMSRSSGEPEVERDVESEGGPTVRPGAGADADSGLQSDVDPEAAADVDGRPAHEVEGGRDATSDSASDPDMPVSPDPPSADPRDALIDDFEWAAEPEPAKGAAAAADTPEADEPPDPYFGAELDADVLDQALSNRGSLLSPDTDESDPVMWPEGATAEELDMGMDTFTLADPDASSDIDGEASPSDTSFDIDGEAPPSDASLDIEGETTSDDDPGPESISEVTAEDDVSDESGLDFGSAPLEVEEDQQWGEPDTGPDTEPDTEVGAEVDGVPYGEPEASTPHDEVSAGLATGAGEADAPPTDDVPDFGMVFDGGAPRDRPEGEQERSRADVEEAASGSSSGADGGRGSSEAAAVGEGADSSEAVDSGRYDPYDRTIPERRGPRSRRPRRSGGGSSAARVAAGVVTVVVVVAGAWVVSGSGVGGPTEEEVVLPALPPELEPQLRELARNASSAMVAEFDSLPQRLALADQPGAQWLTGPYLSTASSFDGVRQYWERFDALLDAMIASEDDIWEAAWREQLAAAQLPAGAEAQLRERGTMGWAAAAADRRAVYGQLRGVIDASLDLHRFLVENESAITFDPSTGGGAGDPVLEVVTATPELGDEMWAGVGRITVALDAVGYIRQVETEPLLDAVTARLVAIGVR